LDADIAPNADIGLDVHLFYSGAKREAVDSRLVRSPKRYIKSEFGNLDGFVAFDTENRPLPGN
jgi:hypothetical protein